MGMCRYRDGEAYTIADIPGLIGGASENRGMGHSFLRHIERTRLLLYVIDVSTYHEFETLPAEASEVPPPSAQFQLLRHELRQYSPSLLGKRCMIVANKIDVDGYESGLEELRRGIKEMLKVQGADEIADLPQIFPVSAKRGTQVGRCTIAPTHVPRKPDSRPATGRSACEGGPG